MVTALIINKVLAVFVGPSGLAAMGQLQNFIQVSLSFSQLGLTSGVTKFAADKNESERDRILSTALTIVLFSSIIVGGCVFFGSKEISNYLFKSTDYAYVLKILGITTILASFNFILVAILNGLREIQFWFKVNIIQSIFSVLYTAVLIYRYQLDGLLFSMVTTQAVVFLLLLYLLRNHWLLRIIFTKNKIFPEDVKRLMKYSFMALTSALVVPISHIVLRDYLIADFGVEKAGYWQATWYISSMYLMVITTTLSVYYLPRFSELDSGRALRLEIQKGISIFVPIAIFTAIIIYVIKDFVIVLLFSSEFISIGELFKFQFLGDVFKVASWFFGYLMLAKEKTFLFVFSEIYFSIQFVVLSVVLCDSLGFEYISLAYALNYLSYFIFSFWFMKHELH
jgi:PST family polysaccharide transporter